MIEFHLDRRSGVASYPQPADLDPLARDDATRTLTAAVAETVSREFERRTHRPAWTQSVPVARWPAVKLAALSPAVLLGGMALSVMLTRRLATLGMTGTAFGHAALFNLVGIAPASAVLALTAVVRTSRRRA